MTSASTVAADMLTRQTRAQAIATAECIVETRGGRGRCAAFWAEVAAILKASAIPDPDNDTIPADDDAFSFSAGVKAQMGRKGL